MNIVKKLLMAMIQSILKKRKYYVVSEKKLNQLKRSTNINHKFYLSFDQIYKKNIKGNNIVIFDIGANKGQSITRFKKIFPNCFMHSFEPITSCIKEIEKSNYSNLILNNFALGEKIYKKQFYKYKDDQISSFYNVTDSKSFPSHIKTEIADKFDSQINTLDNYLLEHKINDIDIIKIDTQGYEEKIIDGATLSLQNKNIKYIELEIIITNNYNFDNQNRFSILNKLKEFNFGLVSLDSISYNKENKISQFNALFKNEKLND